jgi:hypothetical protein
MSALEQEVNSGQISGVSLRISRQMPGAFAALAHKRQVPSSPSTMAVQHYRRRARMPRCGQLFR